MALAEEKEAPLEIPQREEEEEDENAVSPIQQQLPPSSPDKHNISRQSTPLSDLSPPPDDDVPESSASTTSNNNHYNSSVNGAVGGHEDARMMDRRSTEKTSMPPTTAVTARSASRNGMNPSLDPLASSLSLSVNGDAYGALSWGNMFPANTSSGSPTRPSSVAQSHHDPPFSTPSGSQDPRIVAMLELNVDLLRCAAFYPSVMCDNLHRYRLEFGCSSRTKVL